MKILSMILIVTAMSSFALADGKATQCTRLWQLEKEMGCPAMPADFTPVPAEKKEVTTIENDFGPSKAVPREDIDKEKKALKKECDEWLKEQKTGDGKWFGGTCKATCGSSTSHPGLHECTMKGSIKHKDS